MQCQNIFTAGPRLMSITEPRKKPHWVKTHLAMLLLGSTKYSKGPKLHLSKEFALDGAYCYLVLNKKRIVAKAILVH